MSWNQGGYPPPQSNSPYPNQPGYAPPQQQPYGMNQNYQQQNYGGYPPQQGYGPPPGQYNQGPTPQQQWNQGPPPGQYNQGPPPGQYNQGPPPGQYQQGPPPGQYQQGPPPGQYQQGPPPGQYGAPPPGQYGAGQAAPPSPGYVLNQSAQQSPQADRDASDLRNAMKGMGTNENALIKVLAPLDPWQVLSVKTAFNRIHRRDLAEDIHKETSGYFRSGLEGIVRGPLDQDCHEIHEAIKGVGTKESALNDVLLCRSNADLNVIKQRYQQMYRRSLESDVKGDLSMKTERLFDMVMSARRNDESAPVIPQQVDADVQELYRSTEGRSGADQIAVSQIMTNRSNGQIRAISQAYKQKYHRSLDEVLRKEFSGHMEDAFLFILRRCEDPAKHDADMLEDAMKGAGTKDTALVRRIVAVHWNRDRLHQCKAAYKHFYKRELAQRIEGETSGDYKRLMVACIAQH